MLQHALGFGGYGWAYAITSQDADDDGVCSLEIGPGDVDLKPLNPLKLLLYNCGEVVSCTVKDL